MTQAVVLFFIFCFFPPVASMCGSLDILEKLRKNIENCDTSCSSVGKAWFPVFMAFSGNGQAVYDTWFDDKSSTDDILTQYLQTGRKKHIRSKLIDNWRNIREIKLELFDKNKKVVWIKFKGAGTTNKNWLSKQNLLSSSFNDLTPSTTFNYFSMEGEQRGTWLDRKFFINRQYGGCHNDAGWLVIADKYFGCSWERKGSHPVFTYTTNYTSRNWIKDGKTADTMVISVLLNV